MKKSYNELLNDVKIQEEQKKVQAQKEKLIEEKITIESRIRFSKSMVQQSASSLEELKNRLKQISNLKNKLFNRNIYKRNKSELELEIKLKTEYLEKYDTETKLLENRYAEIKKNLNDLKDDIRIQNVVVSLLFFISGNHITDRTKNIIKSLLKQKEEKLCA